ncbi:hypothetical protein KAH94_02515 [bacterium]|nr:hypothetical protein [bacterium]
MNKTYIKTIFFTFCILTINSNSCSVGKNNNKHNVGMYVECYVGTYIEKKKPLFNVKKYAKNLNISKKHQQIIKKFEKQIISIPRLEEQTKELLNNMSHSKKIKKNNSDSEGESSNEKDEEYYYLPVPGSYTDY